MKRPNGRPFADSYWELLQEYLADRSEAVLTRGYDLARRALADGDGILDLADAHHRALRRLVEGQGLSEALLKQAGTFFAECLSPFEMSHRGAQEGTRALRHHNEALEAELKRIAHALHDEAGQMLASVHIALAGLADDISPQSRHRLKDINGLLRQIEGQLRNLSHELRPTVLDNLGLVPALEFLADRVTKRTGLVISVAARADQRLPAAVETALYRIVQEALNNAVKHAQATTVRIEVTCGAASVECSVHDNGRGFDARAEGATPGMGLLGIRERVNALGGSLRVASRPRHGTTLVAGFPLGDAHALTRVAGR
jgi:signal transduction histidine kinase